MSCLENASYWALFVVALLSSVHCTGMCGGFVLACARVTKSAPGVVLGPQLLYHLGKGMTYLALGAVAATAGATMAHEGGALGRLISSLGALLFFLAGWKALGFGAAPSWSINWLRQLATLVWRGIGGGLISMRSTLTPLYLGVFSGLMPCTLVYAFLAEAAARGSFLDGMMVMSLLELGTVPALLALAMGKTIVPPALRFPLTRWSGAFLIVLGLWSCYRGWVAPACCPRPQATSQPATTSSFSRAPAPPAPDSAPGVRRDPWSNR